MCSTVHHQSSTRNEKIIGRVKVVEVEEAEKKVIVYITHLTDTGINVIETDSPLRHLPNRIYLINTLSLTITTGTIINITGITHNTLPCNKTSHTNDTIDMMSMQTEDMNTRSRLLIIIILIIMNITITNLINARIIINKNTITLKTMTIIILIIIRTTLPII